jgi:hypothetical protein
VSTAATPYGLRPVKRLDGMAYAGSTTEYNITSGYSTAIFYGDLVAADANGELVKDSSTTDGASIGVFMGCSYTDPNTSKKVWKQYYPASTATNDIRAYVVDDPMVVFEMQADGTVAQTGMGANYAVVQTAGTTITGNSKVAIDASVGGTTNTHPVRVIGFVDRPGSSVGDAYTDCLVTITHGVHQHTDSLGV